MNTVELEAQIASHQNLRASLHARVAALDVGITEIQGLLGDAEGRLRDAEGDLFRARRAAGISYSFGPPLETTVRWTSGGKTTQLSGPAPPDSPKGQAEEAHRVFDALEQEIAPIRSSLLSMERERGGLLRDAGLLSAEIEGAQGQLDQLHDAERERSQLTGRLDWSGRLAGILRRVAG